MGQSRKDKYVSKAIDILKQEGFLLSLDEMAARMGVTKKTLYNNFSSKEELSRSASMPSPVTSRAPFRCLTMGRGLP